jgi:hypothetical protein
VIQHEVLFDEDGLLNINEVLATRSEFTRLKGGIDREGVGAVSSLSRSFRKIIEKAV